MDVTKEMDVDVIQSSGLLFSSSAAVEIIQWALEITDAQTIITVVSSLSYCYYAVVAATALQFSNIHLLEAGLYGPLPAVCTLMGWCLA